MDKGGFDVSGREPNPLLLVFTSCAETVELRGSITKAYRPIPRKNDGQEARLGEMGIDQLPDGALV